MLFIGLWQLNFVKKTVSLYQKSLLEAINLYFEMFS